MTLIKVYQSLLLFVVYVTAQGLPKLITVRVACHWWRSNNDYYCSFSMTLMKVYLRLLLFLLYDTIEGLLKIITVLV
jgi:hypothetical protein